jgi:predicted DCC family thiol-disulfide oxidoreductase YuxK
MSTPEFPLRVFFDGACPICAREIEHYRHRDRARRLVLVDISAAGFDPAPLGVTLQAFMHELHAIDRCGKVYRGIEAFRAIWQAFPESTVYRALAAVVALPVINPLARLGYRWFARVRPRLPGRKAACAADSCRIGRDDPGTWKGEGR